MADPWQKTITTSIVNYQNKWVIYIHTFLRQALCGAKYVNIIVMEKTILFECNFCQSLLFFYKKLKECFCLDSILNIMYLK